MTDRFNLLIINPKAGKGNAGRLASVFEKYLKEHNFDYRIIRTEYPGHAAEIVKENLFRKNLFIYSIGGDGTLNEVVNGAVFSEAAVISIPSGSGNDFIRSITELNDPYDIFMKSFSSQVSRIDTLKVNERYCINIASAGFDAVVAHNMNHFKQMPFVSGSAAYILGIFKTLINFSFHNFSITIDSKKQTGEYLLAAAANGKYYGGGIKAAPDAKVDDGFLDICIVSRLNKIRIPGLISKYKKGLHEGLKEVQLLKGKKVIIESDKIIQINIDGEIVESDTTVIELIPASLNIIT